MRITKRQFALDRFGDDVDHIAIEHVEHVDDHQQTKKIDLSAGQPRPRSTRGACLGAAK
ncbi:hypothetical protein [Sphingopyxis sp.]|uniref:hypothetical protein n=1 Tax=Sphingopyxis sp. TaxID=1908224 RepID=UPI002B492D51|nr:hypothetical protein [Sphingopyxis sp.]HJS09776.1 hypothetical protein [Sphingopyxis sp.]